MTYQERHECRDLQDRWLALAAVQYQVVTFGWDRRIAGAGSPTFRDVATFVLPQWQGFFGSFF